MARFVLVKVLKDMLALLHPFMPLYHRGNIAIYRRWELIVALAVYDEALNFRKEPQDDPDHGDYQKHSKHPSGSGSCPVKEAPRRILCGRCLKSDKSRRKLP